MNVHRSLWTKWSIAVQVVHKMSSSQKPNSCDFTLVYIHGRQAFAQIVQKIVTRKWSRQTILVEDVLVKPGETVTPVFTRPVLSFTSDDTKKAFVCLWLLLTSSSVVAKSNFQVTLFIHVQLFLFQLKGFDFQIRWQYDVIRVTLCVKKQQQQQQPTNKAHYVWHSRAIVQGYIQSGLGQLSERLKKWTLRWCCMWSPCFNVLALGRPPHLCLLHIRVVHYHHVITLNTQ